MYPQPVVLLTVSNAQMVSLYDNMLVKFVNCPSDLCAAGGAVAGGGGGGGEPLRRTAENLYSPCFGQRGRVIMKIMKENGKTSPWVIVMTGISFIEQLQHCSGVKVRAPACITTKVISRLNTTHRSFGEMDRFFVCIGQKIVLVMLLYEILHLFKMCSKCQLYWGRQCIQSIQS